MKKNIISMGLMAAASLTLTTNCAKTEADFNQAEGTPFELIATSAETKVANDGMATRWSANDQINVFYAEAGSTTYTSAGKFTTATGGSSVTFTGTISGTLNDNNDWYAFYPYNKILTTPANTSTYYHTVGGDQTQGASATATAHLAGDKFPLYGNVKNVARGTTPTIEMKQAMSVVKVHVTNSTGASLTVSSVSFSTEDYNIGGQYYIDFTGDTPVFTEKSGNVYKTATLTVTGGKTFADGETADFYIGVVPFIAATGKTIKLSVNGHERSIVLSKSVSFESGKIKTLNFDYAYPPEVYERVTSLGAFSDGGKYIFAFQDGADADKYYFIQNNGGSKNMDKGLTVVSNTTITDPDTKYVFTAEASSTLFKFKNNAGKYIYNNNGSSSTLNTNNDSGASWYVSSIDGGFFKFNVGNTTGRYISYGTNEDDVKAYGNGSFVNQHTGTGTALAQYSGAITVFKLGGYTAPAGISNETVNDIIARGQSGLTKSVTLTNYSSTPDLTATPDGVVVTSASVTSVTTTSATITYTVAPNYTGAAAVGSITVSDTDSHSGTITVNQIADEFSLSRTTVELNANSGASATMTVYSDYDWTIDDSSLNGFTVSPNSFTYAGNRNQKVTITATGSNTTDSPIDLDVFCVTRTADSKNSDVITVKQKSAKLLAPELTIEKDAANKKFTVSWTAVSNASKYEYYVLDKDANDFISTTQTADASTLSFEVTSINLDEDYYVSVKAIGNASPWIDSDEADEIVNVASTSTHSWVLVNNLSGIVAGRYAIAAYNSSKYYTVPSSTIDGQTFTCTEAAYSATDGLTMPSTAGQFEFTAVTGVQNAYYIYNTSLNKYLVATGSKKFGYVESTSADYGYWTFSTVSSGGFSGSFSVQHSSKTQYMRAYSNSVRCYDGASNNGIYLFIYQ